MVVVEDGTEEADGHDAVVSTMVVDAAASVAQFMSTRLSKAGRTCNLVALCAILR